MTAIAAGFILCVLIIVFSFLWWWLIRAVHHWWWRLEDRAIDRIRKRHP
jgi:hypothetical protein